MNNILDVVGFVGGTICLFDNAKITDAVSGWLYIIGLLLLIASSIVGIIIKIKKAVKDGKVTSEELEDIQKDIKDLADSITNKKD